MHDFLLLLPFPWGVSYRSAVYLKLSFGRFDLYSWVSLSLPIPRKDITLTDSIGTCLFFAD